jgi:hypothetical protein
MGCDRVKRDGGCGTFGVAMLGVKRKRPIGIYGVLVVRQGRFGEGKCIKWINYL